MHGRARLGMTVEEISTTFKSSNLSPAPIKCSEKLEIKFKIFSLEQYFLSKILKCKIELKY